MREFLERNGDLDLSVLIVWMPMYPRPMEWWALSGMVEEFAGVDQFWDDQRRVSAEVKRRIVPEYDGEIPWDMFILFGSEATWTTADEQVVASGHSVLHTQDELFAALGRLPRTKEGPTGAHRD